MGFRQQIGDIWKHITQRTLEPRQWVMMVYRKFASGKILHFLHHYSVPGYVGVRWDEVLKSFFKEIFSGDTNQRAKSLSFSFLVAFPPMLVFLMTLIAYLPLDGVQDEFLHNLSDVLPRKIYATVADTVNDIMGNKRENLQFLGFVFSVWPAASGLNSLFRSFRNPKVEAKTRPWILRMTMSVGMVLVLYVLIILALVLMMEYHHLVDLLTDQGVIRWSANLRQTVGIGRWFLLAIALLIVINLMYFLIDYYWMKSSRERMRFFSIGAIITSAMFLLFTWGFEIYLDNFNNYNLLYGSIGTLLVIFMWIYLNCRMLLVGYELNRSILGVRKDKEQRYSNWSERVSITAKKFRRFRKTKRTKNKRQ
jgi:membrane protein